MKRIVIFSVIVASIFLYISCDTPISKYETKDADEKQIVSLLNTFCDACNSGDLTKLQSIFHDDGVFNSVRGGKVTKSKMTEKNSEWFTISGKIKLKNPNFTIGDDDATVTVQGKHGAHYTTGHRFTLIKVNDRWLIANFQ